MADDSIDIPALSDTMREQLMTTRRNLISALNAVDDLLGLQRTVPSRADRANYLEWTRERHGNQYAR